uniref:Uncharacterized protein n=1 Tax=Physcomitrium patens TaxID=3218 RepID=A0A2K1LBW9_PHYPA|nr:hypothetical protein PHYPA_001952 [Physcomitrium patens]
MKGLDCAVNSADLEDQTRTTSTPVNPRIELGSNFEAIVPATNCNSVKSKL